MRTKILFIHTITNTPYKNSYYNLLAEYFDIHVIQLAHFSEIRKWEPLENKKYAEYVIHHGFINYRKKINSLLKISKLVKKINPEIIVSHGYHRIEFLLIPLFFRNKITLCEVATTLIDKKRRFIKEKIKSLLLNSIFNYFLTYGESSKKYLVNNLNISKKKIFIRGNFSHLQLEKSTICAFSARENKILYVGRFSEEKNLLTLINAFIEFKKNDTNNYKLTLVGSGLLMPQLINYVNISGSNSSIDFVDYKNSDELITYYQNSKLFVLPSYSEPWGQVINEAMHFGLPIVISENCGSVDDLCNENNSRKFNPHKQQELIAIFNDLLLNDSKLEKMGEESLKIIQINSPQKLIEKQVAFFNSILN